MSLFNLKANKNNKMGSKGVALAPARLGANANASGILDLGGVAEEPYAGLIAGHSAGLRREWLSAVVISSYDRRPQGFDSGAFFLSVVSLLLAMAIGYNIFSSNISILGNKLTSW